MVIEWAGVGELVDAIGGVDFEVPMRMRYYDPTQNLNIDLQKGYQHLDGDKAMQLIRFRHNNDLSVGYADGDIGRIATQQAFLKTVIQKCLSSITDIGTITRLVGVFLDNVQTDLTVNNLLYFGEKAILGGLSMDNVTFVTMPAVTIPTAPTPMNGEDVVTLDGGSAAAVSSPSGWAPTPPCGSGTRGRRSGRPPRPTMCSSSAMSPPSPLIPRCIRRRSSLL